MCLITNETKYYAPLINIQNIQTDILSDEDILNFNNKHFAFSLVKIEYTDVFN